MTKKMDMGKFNTVMDAYMKVILKMEYSMGKGDIEIGMDSGLKEYGIKVN